MTGMKRIVAVLVVAAAASGCGSEAGMPTVTASGGQASAATVLPVTGNPIHNSSTVAGLTVANAMVENNTDPKSGQPVADRLQFTVSNGSTISAANLETYYTMTDAVTHQSESYYQKLTGITLAPGQNADIFFDGGSGPGHYPENRYSIYRTSTNGVDVTVEVSATGLAPAHAHAQKSPGTGEGTG